MGRGPELERLTSERLGGASGCIKGLLDSRCQREGSRVGGWVELLWANTKKEKTEVVITPRFYIFLFFHSSGRTVELECLLVVRVGAHD